MSPALDLPADSGTGCEADPRSEFLPFEVHQASGIVSAQLSIPVGEACRVIRDHARAAGRSLLEVSNAVIDRRLWSDH